MSKEQEKDTLVSLKSEIRGLETQLTECDEGLARLDRCRDFLMENLEEARRWQDQFSEPIERFPGGRELREKTEEESRQALSEFQELYSSAKSEYLEKKRELEDGIEARRRRMFSAERPADKDKGGGEK